MIHLEDVTDEPVLFGSRLPLLSNASLDLPSGRYALLSQTPEYHRPIVDLLAGLRAPDLGSVMHVGRVSWPIGRQGFVRGNVSGLAVLRLIGRLFDLDQDLAAETVTGLLSRPQYLERAIVEWPAFVRQEFIFAIGLLPSFDIYVIDSALPFEPSRFTRLWLALFEERLEGKTLIFSTHRQNQLLDYCARALVYEDQRLTIDDDLEQCVERFPPRPSREELGGAGTTGADNESSDLAF